MHLRHSRSLRQQASLHWSFGVAQSFERERGEPDSTERGWLGRVLGIVFVPLSVRQTFQGCKARRDCQAGEVQDAQDIGRCAHARQ